MSDIKIQPDEDHQIWMRVSTCMCNELRSSALKRGKGLKFNNLAFMLKTRYFQNMLLKLQTI